MVWPQTEEVKTTCECGATFYASGNSVSVGCRYREFIEAHKICRYRTEEED